LAAAGADSGSMRLHLCALRILFVLGIPSVSAPHSASGAEPVVQGLCIARVSLGEWQPLDERTVVVWTRTDSRAYLLVLGEPIVNLELAGNIYVFDGDQDGLICANGNDRLAALGLPGGMQRIIAIAALSDEWSAALPQSLASMSRGE